MQHHSPNTAIPLGLALPCSSSSMPSDEHWQDKWAQAWKTQPRVTLLGLIVCARNALRLEGSCGLCLKLETGTYAGAASSARLGALRLHVLLKCPLVNPQPCLLCHQL